MPSAERDAWAAAEAAPRDAEGRVDLDVYLAEYRRRLAERNERLLHEARAAFRAMDDWHQVRTPEAWQETVRKPPRTSRAAASSSTASGPSDTWTRS